MITLVLNDPEHMMAIVRSCIGCNDIISIKTGNMEIMGNPNKVLYLDSYSLPPLCHIDKPLLRKSNDQSWKKPWKK